MLVTLKGLWVYGNKFIADDGTQHYVIAYRMTYNQIVFPLRCYLLVHKYTIITVFPIKATL